MIDPFEEIVALRKSHDTLIALVQTSLDQPPHWTINSQSVAEQLSQKVPDPQETLKQVKAVEERIRQMRNSLPSSIPVKGEFYGFTSWKVFLSYWGVLVITIVAAAYVSFRASDDERVKEYKGLVEDYRRNNPKVADKYFGNWYQRNIGSHF